MEYDRIVVRYGELSLKKRNRKMFIGQLRRNVQQLLSGYPHIKIEATHDRMYILLHGENANGIIEMIQGVFGIQSLSPAVKVEKDIGQMKQAALSLFKSVYQKGNSFKVSTKRADKTFPYDTMEINPMFGSYILHHVPGLTVDVKNPDIDLLIEIRREAVYLSCETILGAGGLPVGSSGKGMLMLSGGLDSPVAGYLAMKRGLRVEAVHFFSPPYTSERAKQKVIDLMEKLVHVGGKMRLHIVPFTEIQELIQKEIPESYLMTTTRRLMLRITDIIREKHDGLAIISGESLGQVASQTIESMYTINEVTNTPILRPLITMDKSEIIEIAKEIDTHDISIRPHEDCCTIFVPANPKTNPRREKVNQFESTVDFAPYINRAVEQTKTMVIGGKNNKLDSNLDELF